MIVIIDNYDSFTYNICHCIDTNLHRYTVVKNDQITASDIKAISPSHIIISPGPYSPQKGGGICIELVKELYKSVPILGICLGAQIIAHAFGAQIEKGAIVAHGIVSEILCDNKHRLFKGLPKKIVATRYHSLCINKRDVEKDFNIIASTEDSAKVQTVMAIKHRTERLYGVQFHPESVMTGYGRQMIDNFLEE